MAIKDLSRIQSIILIACGLPGHDEAVGTISTGLIP